MMPVVRLNDATFLDLKAISTWMGTETPSQTIVSLVREKMEALDLERDIEGDEVAVSTSDDTLTFDKVPGLSFTRILSATINGKTLNKTNWAGLLLNVIALVKVTKHLTAEGLARELQVPARAKNYAEEGFKFHPELGVSIQGQSAQDAWKEVSRLAQKFGIRVEVRFQWRDNEKAQHPGRTGLLRAGG